MHIFNKSPNIRLANICSYTVKDWIRNDDITLWVKIATFLDQGLSTNCVYNFPWIHFSYIPAFPLDPPVQSEMGTCGFASIHHQFVSIVSFAIIMVPIINILILKCMSD